METKFSSQLLVIFIVYSVCIFCEAELQSLSFYSQPACQNLTDTIHETYNSFGDIETITNAQTISVLGLWQYQQLDPFTGFGFDIYIYRNGTWDTCQNKVGTNFQFQKAARYGSADQKQPHLSLFIDTLFGGIEYALKGNSTTLQLPRPLMIQSLFISGNHNYTVYDAVNFNGNSFCLRPIEAFLSYNEAGEAWGMSYNWRSRIPIGSVRYGCELQ